MFVMLKDGCQQSRHTPNAPLPFGDEADKVVVFWSREAPMISKKKTRMMW